MTALDLDGCLAEYNRNRHHLKAWAASITEFFTQHPTLSQSSDSIVHSVRMRMKDEAHLRDKLQRKAEDGTVVNPSTLLNVVTDLAGVRLLHLFQLQFDQIHYVIQEQVKGGNWALHEKPVAYTWDPECTGFFDGLGLRTEIKESHYTSIHYVLKPRADSTFCCEVQVRPLFEEAWGEIDHQLNYPHQTSVRACREQLRVLAKLVGASTRLADSIYRTHAPSEPETAG
jgi:ppGpp synthetase/RelA/SpoT-type nucleotidyltranferase